MYIPDLKIFDCEVYSDDWLFVFKDAKTNVPYIIWNDNDLVSDFMKYPHILCGYNNKHYDSYILKAVMLGMSPAEIKRISDAIIVHGVPGWQIPALRDCGIYFEQFDLMDDVQHGTSLKDIEGHLGMDIRETTVSFDINRPLTFREQEEVTKYCLHDVDATLTLFKLREVYIANKMTLGKEKGITPGSALYMTNAKLTSAYLDAKPRKHDDERNYVFPDDILWQYIPDEVKAFFDRIHDESIPDDDLWNQSIDIMVGDCPTRVAWGGIHGAIPHYREETTEDRVIKNADVGSYYPHLMTLNGYASRNIPSVTVYEDMLKRRMEAKKVGNKSLANALKLVANTTYGAMLNQYNDLYDPLNGRSVCITGQLRLLELANHLLAECPTLKVVQLNTDGIMCSFDNSDGDKWDEILREWQDRTKFTLEEDTVLKIVQKDVNNYIELPEHGEAKVKGGYLVRGLVTNGDIDFEAMGFPKWNNLAGGAFKINNNCVVVSKAVIDHIAYGIPVEDTINNSTNIFDFQIIAKTWAKCGNAYHKVCGTMIEQQRVNRVYATDRFEYGTLYMIDPDRQDYRKVTGVPEHLLVDNTNILTIDTIDRDWYIRLAKRYVNDFLGIKTRRNAAVTRKLNKLKREILSKL